MALADEVKLALRVTSSAYDDEVEALIAAAKDDLLLSGVSYTALEAVAPDALVKRAIVLYCKAEFGLDNPDSDKYMRSFHALETHLALSSEYQEPVLDGITGTMAAGSDELTVSDATNIAEDAWLSVAGAGVGGALLICQAAAIVDSVVTLSRVAATAVNDAEVKLL